MLFWQFSNIIVYVKIVGKIPDQDLSVWLLSNPRDKVQILVEGMGQIFPVVFHLFWTLSPGFENNHTFKCSYGIFLTILTYMIMLENCQNNISVYDSFQIQGTTFYSCWNLMKPGFQSGTYLTAFFCDQTQSGWNTKKLVKTKHQCTFVYIMNFTYFLSILGHFCSFAA